MTVDDNKDIDITYNYLNLPVSIVRNTGSTGLIKHYYAGANKVRMEVYSDAAGTTLQKTYDYLGSSVYIKEAAEAPEMEFMGMPEGRVLFARKVLGDEEDPERGNIFKYEYQLRDHLGNLRVSCRCHEPNRDETGRVIAEGETGRGFIDVAAVQFADYDPWGLSFESPTVSPSEVEGLAHRFLYQGKELQPELETYDFHARMYDPALGRTFQQDPMGEMFYSLSSYSWAANNPISFVDPSGMVIEEGSQKEWDKQKQNVQNRRDNLQGKIDKLGAKAEAKGWSAEKLANKTGNLTERVGGLDGTLSTMGTLESSEQVYALDAGAADNQVSYDASTGNVVISYSGTSLFVHETTHAGQFESGDIAFDSKTGNTLAQDVHDEAAGYKSQWAYDPASVGGLKSSSQITTSWVQGISKPNGDQPYKPGGSANTGIAPVNINSNRDALIRAYPHLKGSLQGLPSNATLKSISPSMYYKK